MSLFPTKSKTSISQLSVSVDAYVLGTSEKETYTSFGLLCLVSLTYSFQGRHAAATYQTCVLFYCWITHEGAIHSPVDGQLDSSHFGLMTNTLICLYKKFCVGHIVSFLLDWNL